MSNDNDSNKPGADDDGWGDADQEATPPAEPAPPAPEDPANLEERVAALHENRDQPTEPKVVVEESVPVEPFDYPPATVQSPPAPSTEFPVVAPPPVSTEVPTDEAPHWSPSSQEISTPSSDLLVAAEVLAQKENEPSAKKRRKLKKKLEKDPRTQLTRRQLLTLVGGAALLVLAGVGAVLGWMNNQNYYLVCGTRSITAEQGSFWPWGRAPLPGEAFKAIEGDHPCTDLEFDSRAKLEQAFLEALIEQATRLLTSGDPEKVASAEQELEQALLLSRDPERGKERAEAKRLQGDVSYWRGASEIQNALEVLGSSASYFEEAAKKRPRHSNDASDWAEHARFISDEIDKGPRALRKDESPKEEPHFQGLTQPPPDAGDDEPDAPPSQVEPSQVEEAPADTGVAPEDPVPPADASLPKGGVLL